MYRVAIANPPAHHQPEVHTPKHGEVCTFNDLRLEAAKNQQHSFQCFRHADEISKLARKRAAAARQKDCAWLVRRLGIEGEDPVLSLAKGGYVMLILFLFVFK